MTRRSPGWKGALALALPLGALALALACPTAPQPGNPVGTHAGGPPADGVPDGKGGTSPPPPPPTRVPFGLTERPSNPTCVAPPRPLPATGATTAPAFPRLTFVEPLFALQAPGDDSRVYVVERGGRVRVFANDDGVTSSTVFVDLSGKVEVGHSETGLLGMAFHPDFARTGEVFLSYVADLGGDLTSVISRFVSRDKGLTLDPKSEQVVLQLEQPHSTHNGGHIAFGPDGSLYIGFGDGGGGGDPYDNGQDLNSLLGKLLRIDVDGAKPYAIPPDNPFRTRGRPEIYALGFRNPWRWSFDRATGELWLADVGEKTLEEVDRVVAGGNYGWNIMEGTDCFEGGGCNGPGLSLPVLTYGRDDGVSITGGYVYRGTRVPALVGHYVYGDFGSGNLWAFDPMLPVGEDNPRRITPTSFSISSFGELNDGELLVVDYGGGKLHRLVPAGEPSPSQLAPRLSQTGCVDPADPRRLAPGVLAYDVNAALWSDGSAKARSLAVPDGTQVTADASGRLTFPPGSVLLKNFAFGDRLVETRLFMRHPDGVWAGYSYEWNEAQTDAVLLEDGKQVAVDGHVWTFPSRAECMLCHTGAAGFVLGPEVAQLNGDLLYPGNTVANQLETLEHIGVLGPLPGPVDTLPRLAHPSGTAPLAERARAYLHANCAYCHRPGGLGRGTADLRYDTPLEEAGLCNAPAAEGDMGVPGARLLVPGDPSRSLLSLRMHTRTSFKMPPLATAVPDPEGTALVDAWIRSLQSCP